MCDCFHGGCGMWYVCELVCGDVMKLILSPMHFKMVCKSTRRTLDCLEVMKSKSESSVRVELRTGPLLLEQKK